MHWLLVEDDAAEGELAREALANSDDIDLAIVRTGEEALRYLRRQNPYANARAPSLVLLDVNLPDMSGRDVLAAIRADPQTRRIPVLMLSTSSEEKDVAELYEGGANCYLVKPLHHAQFVTMIQSVNEFWMLLARVPRPLF